MVKYHGIFQEYYFFHFVGFDRNMREKFRGHPHFERTEEFCCLFDQAASIPTFKSIPLKAFEPMLQRVFCQRRQSIYVAKRLSRHRRKTSRMRRIDSRSAGIPPSLSTTRTRLPWVQNYQRRSALHHLDGLITITGIGDHL